MDLRESDEEALVFRVGAVIVSCLTRARPVSPNLSTSPLVWSHWLFLLVLEPRRDTGNGAALHGCSPFVACC